MNIEQMNINMFGEAAAYLENSRRQMSGDLGEVIKSTIGEYSIETFLDVGCGIGFLSNALHTLFPNASDRGIDASVDLVEVAKKQKPRELNFEYGNAYEINSLDNTYDLTACQTLLIHLKNPKLAISEMRRVTKSGGRLLIIEPVIHADGLVSYIPGQGAIKKSLGDKLLQFDISRKLEDGINMLIAPQIPHLLLEAGASNVTVNTFSIVNFAEEDKCGNPNEIKYSSYDYFMLSLGYSEKQLEYLRRAEAEYQTVKGELNVVTLLVVAADA
ncbi:MAG: methyltransferase domain-containing protein [Cyanobacteria bacterium P01_H01_bin.21]